MSYHGQKYAISYYGKEKFPEDSFLIKGVSFNQETCKNLEIDEILVLTPEPTNQFDNSAIKITTQEGDSCGYVPKQINEIITDGYVKVINKKYSRETGYGIRVEPCINENEVIQKGDL